MDIPFGPLILDLPDFENPGMTEVLNAIPYAIGYGPLADLGIQSDALTARCQGSISGRAQAGTLFFIAGDATKLYKINTGGITWDNVSRTSGGAYATASDGRWSFCQFGNSIIAVNGVDAPQLYTLGSSTDFAALGGSPPTGSYIAAVRDFVMMGRIASSNLNRVQWSAINDPADWVTSATTLADQQDLPDGGEVSGIVGGEVATVLQQRAIKRATFVGPPTIFQFDEISRETGCAAPGSVAAYENNVFFVSDTGFHVLIGLSQIEDIGAEKFNRYFWRDVDESYLDRVTATFDPVLNLYVVAYPGAGSSGGTPNHGLIFSLTMGKVTRFEVTLDCLLAAVQAASGYTLDTLDSVNSSIDALTLSFDSSIWTGKGRPLLAAFNIAFKLGFFDGPNLAATFETAEMQLSPGRRTVVLAGRPMVDGGTSTLRVGTRNLQTESVTWGAVSSVNEHGSCPVRAEGRYHRARLEIAAGGTWMHALGIADVRALPGGKR